MTRGVSLMGSEDFFCCELRNRHSQPLEDGRGPSLGDLWSPGLAEDPVTPLLLPTPLGDWVLTGLLRQLLWISHLRLNMCQPFL